MKPLSFESLLKRIFREYKQEKSIFYLPERYFYKKDEKYDLSSVFRGRSAATPIGPAAGPHTQMAQNIICAWLGGARIIELKTVQVMDDLEIPRPCIDVTNVCCNVEWSQELKIDKSLEEYVKTWYLLHILCEANLGDIGASPKDTLFDLSVGYNLEGIRGEKVMGFIQGMKDSTKIIDHLRKEIPEEFSQYRDLEVDPHIACGVTLSTFHGCPPDEIEKIAVYLLKEVGLDTVIKLNPTLLGQKRLTEILHDQLGYHHVDVPKEAFEKDLQFETAIDMVTRLREVAKKNGRHFGVKFNNTLVTRNHGKRFSPSEMYLSGRPLHVLAMNLVQKFRKHFGPELPISFSAGIDVENICDAMASNLTPITVCTDILRPGGYGRLTRYMEKIRQSYDQVEASNRSEYILNRAEKSKIVEFLKKETNPVLVDFINLLNEKSRKQSISSAFANSKEEFGCDENIAVEIDRLYNHMIEYAGAFNSDAALEKINKTDRYTAYRNKAYSPKIGENGKQFDCISAPCTYACPLHINVPRYVELIRKGEFAKAIEVIRENNPLPSVCGRVCSHPCEIACRQRQWDDAVAIRALKRVVSDAENQKPAPKPEKSSSKSQKVAIVGSGPAGLTAAHFLAKEGYQVVIYEALPKPGGMLAYGIPEFRLPEKALQSDIERIQALGVEIRCNQKIGENISLNDLEKEYDAVFIGVGAYKSRRLNIEGEEAEGCMDCLSFLRDVRMGKETKLGKKVAIIGGGNAAMDAARTAWRLNPEKVYLVYRRSKSQMPADIEEIDALIEEGIEIHEQATPIKIHTKDNCVTGIECLKTRLSQVDESGRARPVPIEGSNFTLEVDNVLVAISQEPDIEELVAGSNIDIEKGQTFVVDQKNLSTKQEGIFAGGDLVRGADTIVAAMGDGKNAATFIQQYLEKQEYSLESKWKTATSGAQEGKDTLPWKISHTHSSALDSKERKNFNEVESVLDDENAKLQAERCLHCDVKCNICVEVCPNRANFAFEAPVEKTPYEVLGYKDSQVAPIEKKIYQIHFPNQVGNLADLCNECGNCDNFCPETGGPYKIKTALFRSLENLQKSEKDGYFLQKENGQAKMWAKAKGHMHTLDLDPEKDIAIFANDTMQVKLKYKTAEILESKCLKESPEAKISLEVFLCMRTLIHGLEKLSFIVG